MYDCIYTDKAEIYTSIKNIHMWDKNIIHTHTKLYTGSFKKIKHTSAGGKTRNYTPKSQALLKHTWPFIK